MIPKFLRPERVPVVSIAIVPPVSDVERTIEETQRTAFHTFLTHPATGPTLDAMLADNAKVDAKLTLVPAPICPWCPEFDPANQPDGLSHGICADCADRFAREDEDRDEDRGSRCGPGCGWCGGCS
jgi:hypothetical protein